MQMETILEIVRDMILRGRSNKEIYEFFKKDKQDLAYSTVNNWIRMIYSHDLQEVKMRASESYAHKVLACSDNISKVIRKCNEILDNDDASYSDQLNAAKLLKEAAIDNVKVEAHMPTAVARTNLMIYNESDIQRQIPESNNTEHREEDNTQS